MTYSIIATPRQKKKKIDLWHEWTTVVTPRCSFVKIIKLFSFHLPMSKIQNSISIYLSFWRRLMRQSQDFWNPLCFGCDVIMIWYCDATAVIPDTIVCSQRQLATSTAELTLLTTWLDCGKRMIRKIPNAGSRVSYDPYYGLELPNHGIRFVLQNINSKTFFGLEQIIKRFMRKQQRFKPS